MTSGFKTDALPTNEEFIAFNNSRKQEEDEVQGATPAYYYHS